MDRLTKFIGYFAPKAAANRLRSQIALEMMDSEVRKFDGAGRGRRFNDWGYGNASQNQQIVTSLPLLRERSRDLVRNNGYAKNAIRRIGNNVVGTGIIPSPVSKNKNQAQAKAEEDIFKAVWKLWADSTECDFDGLLNFYGLQNLIAKTVAKSGSCYVRRVWKRKKKGTVPLQIQVLDPDLLDRTKTGQFMDNGEYTLNGIQFDKSGKRIAYWMYDRHPLDFALHVQSKPVPAEDIQQVFDVEDPGQIEGLPFMSSVLLPMKDFDEYQDAQLVRQKIAACYAAFITTTDGATMPSSKAGTGKRGLLNMQPGIVQELNAGESVEFANPPSTEGFSEYSRQSLLVQAAGIGVSYEAYTGDLTNVNFSSGRMGWIEFQRNIDHWQWNMMIPMVCDPVWKWFCAAAYLADLIKDTNVGVTWTPPRREMIDPVKESKALSMMVRNGFMSWQDAVRSLGYNPDDILEELKKDAKNFTDSGLMPECDTRFDAARKIDVKKAKE